MDPFMAALVQAARRMGPGGGAPEAAEAVSPTAIAAVRQQYAQAAGLVGLWPNRRVSAEDLVASGVSARRYVPPGSARGTLVFFHGGGFIMGGLDTHDALCRTAAAAAQVRVLSVDYRLAPEHPFPAAVEDALAVWDWAVAHEPGPHGVGGDSAGGNLAAVIAGQRRGGMGPAVQGLLYPVVDMIGEYASIARFGTGFLLTEAGLRTCAELYMPAAADRGEPRLSPLLGDLSGVAPAVIATAGFDPLVDQGSAYGEALRAAGVRAVSHLEEGLVHGFADFAGVVPAARQAVQRWAEAIGNEMGAAR